MLDVQKVNDTKQRILSMITTAGPSFPAKISRETNISPLFVGALLSELVAEQKLVMSSMKVGSSPLYLVKGQEQNLEKFTQYLNSKEQEVVFRLKQIQLLDDSAEDPATRVALRKIKDFAIPVSAKVDGEEKLFWKYFTLGELEANSILQKADKPKKAQKEDKAEEVEEKKEQIKEIKQEIKKEVVKETQELKEEIKQEKSEKRKAKKTIEKEPSKFVNSLKECLSSKNIGIITELLLKPKEYHAQVKVDHSLGVQEYLLIAKDKKKLTEDDLAIALHKAQEHKMPALLMSKGDLDKPAQAYLEQWRNLIKFEKLKS